MLMTVFLNVRLINNEEACEEVMESLWMEWLPGPTIVILSEPSDLIASMSYVACGTEVLGNLKKLLRGLM